MATESPKFGSDWFKQKWSNLRHSDTGVFQDYYLFTDLQLTYKNLKNSQNEASNEELASAARKVVLLGNRITIKKFSNENYKLIFDQLDHDYLKLVETIDSNQIDDNNPSSALEEAANVMKQMIDLEV